MLVQMRAQCRQQLGSVFEILQPLLSLGVEDLLPGQPAAAVEGGMKLNLVEVRRVEVLCALVVGVAHPRHEHHRSAQHSHDVEHCSEARRTQRARHLLVQLLAVVCHDSDGLDHEGRVEEQQCRQGDHHQCAACSNADLRGVEGVLPCMEGSMHLDPCAQVVRHSDVHDELLHLLTPAPFLWCLRCHLSDGHTLLPLGARWLFVTVSFRARARGSSLFVCWRLCELLAAALDRLDRPHLASLGSVILTTHRRAVEALHCRRHAAVEGEGLEEAAEEVRRDDEDH
mmetsp:Transcript_1670/g.5934  ORF Transcript_1670/g.5934 Transcript_1670/m.5934 type:complete len:284 (+) Transcript_1670:173-1024(+)